MNDDEWVELVILGVNISETGLIVVKDVKYRTSDNIYDSIYWYVDKSVGSVVVVNVGGKVDSDVCS